MVMVPPRGFEDACDYRSTGDHDDKKEVLYLREKIVEAVREGDTQDASYLLGLSVGRKLVPAYEKARHIYA